MTITQTIQLDDSERLALQRALSIIDKISDVAKVSMDTVFNYFCESADVGKDYEYHIKAFHDIENIR